MPNPTIKRASVLAFPLCRFTHSHTLSHSHLPRLFGCQKLSARLSGSHALSCSDAQTIRTVNIWLRAYASGTRTAHASSRVWVATAENAPRAPDDYRATRALSGYSGFACACVVLTRDSVRIYLCVSVRELVRKCQTPHSTHMSRRRALARRSMGQGFESSVDNERGIAYTLRAVTTNIHPFA